MKKILIVPVNYNSYDYLDSYLKSVSEAWNLAKDECELTVYVADNSTKPEDIDLSQYNLPDLRIKRLDNLGYFGGALHVINNCVDVKDYDYVIISNVDMEFFPDFLQTLSAITFPQNTGWISPYRFSKKYNKPLTLGEKKTRKPILQLILLLLYFKCPYIVKKRWNRNKRNRSANIIQPPTTRTEIYYGCGSCFILSKTFFSKNPNISYPVFLYGEEMLVAELNRIHGLSTYYEPELKVFDVGNISTGNINIKRICDYNYSAIKYILSKFY